MHLYLSDFVLIQIIIFVFLPPHSEVIVLPHDIKMITEFSTQLTQYRFECLALCFVIDVKVPPCNSSCICVNPLRMKLTADGYCLRLRNTSIYRIVYPVYLALPYYTLQRFGGNVFWKRVKRGLWFCVKREVRVRQNSGGVQATKTTF